jgi:glycosyltransferase involved in cell wall biosynthesis
VIPGDVGTSRGRPLARRRSGGAQEKGLEEERPGHEPRRSRAPPPNPDPNPGLPMRVALVHDWLTGMRGGERVLEALLDLFPGAEIFTLLHLPGSVSRRIESRPIHTSFVQRLPGISTRYRHYLPLFPTAVERFDLSGFDLVLSSSHCVAKGVPPPPGVPHLCYCHTPMRYVWDQYDAYFGPGRAAPWVRAVMPVVAHRLRRWDRASAGRVHRFVANSHHVRRRIHHAWGRPAGVVHPPVDQSRFRPARERADFFLVLGALTPYKRVDLAVEACNRLGRPLVVAGSGPEKGRLRKLAGPTVRFAGWVSDDEAAELLARCRALLMPQVEDFGITAVEAQAAGAPVVAFGAGGALETVVPLPGDRGSPGSTAEPTGVFFHRQAPEELAAAIVRAEAHSFRTEALVANARRFSPERFRREMTAEVEGLLASFRHGGGGAAPRDPGPA